ncbi:MAG: hypothetical protein KQJ78_20240 [Deltaproteobacteria bacterium]|nr:hypothetical protein [Deltaproteobacteria bacterium]
MPLTVASNWEYFDCLAIITGAVSHLFVVDADGPAGERFLAGLPVTGV